MKSRFFLLLILVNYSVNVFGTHERAGYITVTYVSDLTYQATITTFTKASSVAADRDTMNLDWGDGTIEKVLRSNGPVGTNGVPQGEVLPGGYDLKLNIYRSAVHTYPYPCDYVVSTCDPNRIANIININGGASVNLPLYIETCLRAEAGVCKNSAAVLLSKPLLLAQVNDTFSFNPTFSDPDGDSLYFELVPPLAAHSWAVPYQFPDEIHPGNNSFSINHISGQILWITPQKPGAYNVAIKISEFKNGLFYGYSIFDHHIIVDNMNLNPPTFTPNFQADSTGNYSFTVNPHDTLRFNFSVNADSLSAIGELFHIVQGEVLYRGGTPPFINASLLWIPDSSHSRLSPYITTFRASNQNASLLLERDLTVLIYVTGGSRPACAAPPSCNTSIADYSESQPSFTIFPNPCPSSCKIKMNEASGELLTLRLFDVAGKSIYSLQSSNGEFILQKKDLADGLYLFVIDNPAASNSVTGKVILK